MLARAFAMMAGLLLAWPPLMLSAEERAAPAFTHAAADDWINSPPLSWKDLRGKVVLLDFWTFDCYNCYRSIPWIKSVEQRFAGKNFQVIGVHTPEFAHERVRANVEVKVKKYGLASPVMMDNDSSYWNAMRNRYWPAFYLIDGQGRIRGTFVGETHAGDERAAKMEAAIAVLLKEPAAAP